MPMKKNLYCHTQFNLSVLFFVLLAFLLPNYLFSQQMLSFVAERDTIAREWNGNEMIIHAGDIIASNSIVYYNRLSSAFWLDDEEFHLTIRFDTPAGSFATFAKYFRPVNTEDVFGEDIFVDFPVEHLDPHDRVGLGVLTIPGDVDRMWVSAHLRDVLIGQDRDMLLEVVPDLILNDFADGRTSRWYESASANIGLGRAMFYNSVVKIGFQNHFAVRNIRRTNFGYEVDSVISMLDWWDSHIDILIASYGFRNRYQRGDEITLRLYLDGDYLDIYTAGSNVHIGTFVRVCREFITQYHSLIRTNTANLSNIQWPRRADGTMSIIPPPVDMSGFYATHTTTARLNIRNNPNITAPLVTTLELGTEVQILETGSIATIGEITAPWVRVLSADGFIGWCFSGFLEAIAVEAAVVESPVLETPAVFVSQVPIAVQTDTAASITPQWAWFVIIGGAVMAGGAVLFVARRKRA